MAIHGQTFRKFYRQETRTGLGLNGSHSRAALQLGQLFGLVDGFLALSTLVFEDLHVQAQRVLALQPDDGR